MRFSNGIVLCGERLEVTGVEEGWELGCWADYQLASGIPRMRQGRAWRRESTRFPDQTPEEAGEGAHSPILFGYQIIHRGRCLAPSPDPTH